MPESWDVGIPVLESGSTDWDVGVPVSDQQLRVANQRHFLTKGVKPEIEEEAGKTLGMPNLLAAARSSMEEVAGLTQRIVGNPEGGPTADERYALANAYESAANEVSGDRILPRAVRGAYRSAVPMLAAGGNPYLGLGFAGVAEGSSSLAEARAAGMKPNQAMAYAVTQGAIEASIGAVFQKAGLGGFEDLLGGTGATKQIVRAGLANGLKQAGIRTLQELPEEYITEIGHKVTDKISGMDPEALSKESLGKVIANTTAQVFVTMGVGEAPALGAAAARGFERSQRLAQLKTVRAKGYVSAEEPRGFKAQRARNDWPTRTRKSNNFSRRFKMPSKYGEMLNAPLKVAKRAVEATYNKYRKPQKPSPKQVARKY
jgi:hypothetical protein